MVDHLLRAALNLGVAALHRVKVQIDRVAATGQRTGGTAAHAYAHARAAELNQQGTGGEKQFVGEFFAHHAQATGQHDGLVVTALHTIDHLFVFAEIAQQIRSSELVVKSCAAQGAFGHDLQSRGHVRSLSYAASPKFGNAETGQACFGFGSATSGTFVTDLAAGTGSRTRKR